MNQKNNSYERSPTSTLEVEEVKSRINDLENENMKLWLLTIFILILLSLKCLVDLLF